MAAGNQLFKEFRVACHMILKYGGGNSPRQNVEVTAGKNTQDGQFTKEAKGSF